ncbi:MAG: basic secretory protein-like protein [Thermoguttaceae bacterium]|jgi:hypothetical protein
MWYEEKKSSRLPVLVLAAAGWLATAWIPTARGDDPADAKPAIQVDLDMSEVPEMKDWCLRAKEILEQWYPKVVETLGASSYPLPRHIKLIFKNSKKGIAGTAGNQIFCTAAWFKAHPDDYGALVHEMVHVVQAYPKYDPPWLVEGIADYVRFWVYEPGAKRPRLNPARARYQDGYKTTGAFLAWLVAKYDKDLVRKLNTACHKNQYEESLFRQYTGKDLDALWSEFKGTLTAR